MNTQVTKMMNVLSGITNFIPVSHSVQRLPLKSLKNSTLFCRQGRHLHFVVSSHIRRTSTQRGATSASIKSITNDEHHRTTLYSTQNSHQQPNDGRDEAKHQGKPLGEIGNETSFQSTTGDEARERNVNVYVRKASTAKEKMKEKMADRVKDVKENIFTIPNLLSTTRLALSPVLGYLVIHECYTMGACLFTFAGITDLLDGFIARNFKNQQSVLGSIIDPLADKCLVTILALSLTISGLIPVPLTVLMISRDVSLVGSVVYLRYQSLLPPRSVSRFFDVTHATVQLKPTAISKLNTVVQLGLVGFTLAAPVFHYIDHPLLHALWYTTAATTILSSLSYVFSKDAFKFLRK